MLRLLSRNSVKSHALIGASAALAILSKYNGLIALAGTAFAAVVLPRVRHALTPRGLLAAGLVFAIILAPPLIWLASGRLGTLDDSAGKFAFDGTGSIVVDRLQGLAMFAGVCLGYAGPLLALVLSAAIVAWADGRTLRVRFASLAPGVRYLLTAIAASFVIALVLVLASGATTVKGYWLHPVLVTLPAATAAVLERFDRTGWANRFIIACAMLVALASVVVFVLRAFGVGM